MIARIGDVAVARRIHGQATWPIQLCVLSRTTIPAKSGRPRPRAGREHERISSPRDAADPMGRRIREEQIPTGVEGEATRRPELPAYPERPPRPVRHLLQTLASPSPQSSDSED